jgi:hypothetical protein
VRFDSFRQWLVVRLATTRVAKPAGMSDDEFAAALGVHRSVWDEAKSQIPTRKGRSKVESRTSTKKIGIEMPKVLYEALNAYSSNQDLQSSVLVRSCIDWLLKRPTIEVVGNYAAGQPWTFLGKPFTFNSKARATERHRIQAGLSVGAYDAINIRAGILGTSAFGLTRGAVIDLMEGRIKTLPIVAQASYMLDDASKYMEYWK